MPELSHTYEQFEINMGSSDVHQLQFQENDEKIRNATIKAVESGSLTPLIKEELRCTIQSRRLAEGKGELKVEFKSPPKKKAMTEEERGRALKRRVQNREAAQRFRQRQKDTSDYLSAKIQRLEKSTVALTETMQKLREERDLLQEMLKEHMLVCPNKSNPETTEQTEINIDELLSQFTDSTQHVSSVEPAQFNPRCPDTASSDASTVFFAEEDEKPTSTSTKVHSNFGLQHVEETRNQSPIAGQFGQCDIINIVCENGMTIPLEVCYEEVVSGEDNMDTLDEECCYNHLSFPNQYRQRHTDSCSSIGADSTISACSAETGYISLSESTSDLRHSLTSAYSKVHFDSCPSVPYDNHELDQDFLL